MILKKLLNSQALKFIKTFKKNHNEIFDFVIYGSFIRGKYDFNDIDIAIVLSEKMKLDKKLSLAQKFKNELKKIIDFDFDVKTVDVGDLIDKSFLARKDILSEGFMVLKNKFLHEFVGFSGYYVFYYNLKGLSQAKKVMFQYALFGRRGEKGILKELKGEVLGRGVLRIPLVNVEDFKSFFDKQNINYKIQRSLVY